MAQSETYDTALASELAPLMIIPPPSATVIKALKKADSRVKDSARWLLEFARKDLSNAALTKKQFSKLAEELVAVAKREAGDIFGRTLSDPFAGFLMLDDRGQASQMGALQGWLKEQFEQAKAGQGWKVDSNLAPFKIINLFNRHSRDESLVGDAYVAGSVDCFKVAANRIVERERERFGICQNPRCDQLFVAERKGRGKYCAPRCASYVNVMKSRGKF